LAQQKKTSKTWSEHAIHAPETDYLYIENSRIAGAGRGLFTAITIYKEEIIAVYTGETITEQESCKTSFSRK
jgi:hypothetical protein